MKKNMGTADRVIRILIAIVIFALGWYFHTWWGLVGLLPLLTAFVGYCCLYKVFGMNTCPTKEKP